MTAPSQQLVDNAGQTPASTALPAASRQPQQASQPDQPAEKDCMTCRVTGTLVSAACAGYLLAVNYSQVPPPRGLHRTMLLALSGGFAAMAVVRAVT